MIAFECTAQGGAFASKSACLLKSIANKNLPKYFVTIHNCH